MPRAPESAPLAANIESAWRLVDREVWIVTAAHKDHRGGLVATWVNRASLDPARPLALVALAASHFTTELVLASGEFAVHLLSPDNIKLAWNFALGSGRDRDKFHGLSTTRGVLSAPLLPDALAALECRIVKHYNARERHYLWGEIVACPIHRDGLALRESQLIASATPEQRSQLKQELVSDIARLSSEMNAWLAE